MLLSSIGFVIGGVFLDKDFDLEEFLEKALSAMEAIKSA
jgi:hypothetical protein